jgi:Family of unknown function (DUF5985)
MTEFLSGAIMLGSAAVGVFFFRSWRRTRERLLLLFSLAFAVLAGERWVLFLVGAESQLRSYVYLIRLAAFGLILAAIIDKNRVKPSR